MNEIVLISQRSDCDTINCATNLWMVLRQSYSLLGYGILIFFMKLVIGKTLALSAVPLLSNQPR